MNIQNYIISNLKQFPKVKLYFRNFIRKYNFVLNYNSVNKNKSNLDKNIIKAYNSTREFGFQKYLCHAPFSSIYFKTNGEVVACCKNTKDLYGNVMKNNISEIWDSMIKFKLQENIKKNDLEFGCKFCKHQLLNKNYSGVHARIHDQAFFKDENIFPAEITLEISNRCNLECVMCSGEYSSLLRKNKEGLPPIEDRYPDDFVEQLKPFLKAAKVVRLQGGEPFLIDDYLKILEYLNNENKNCKIYIQTNGTVYNKRVEKILKNKEIQLSISMDSLEKDKLESIRKNLNYTSFKNNLTKFTEISVKNNSTLNINFCLMKNNWNEIPNLFEFCYNNGYSLNIIPLDYPIINALEHFSVSDIEKIIAFLKLGVSKELKFKYALIYNGLLNSLDNTKQLSINRNNYVDKYKKLNLDELYSLININLIENKIKKESIDYIISYFKTKLETKNLEIQNAILANSILNNQFFEEIDHIDHNLDLKLTKKIIEYFDYELSLLS